MNDSQGKSVKQSIQTINSSVFKININNELITQLKGSNGYVYRFNFLKVKSTLGAQ